MKRSLTSLLLLAVPLMVAGIVWFLAGGSEQPLEKVVGPGPDGQMGARVAAPFPAKARDNTEKATDVGSSRTPGGQAAAAYSNRFGASFSPGRPGAMSVAIPLGAPKTAPQETAVLAPDFLEKMVDNSRQRVRFTLPDGSAAGGTVELLREGDHGIVSLQGRLETPEPGDYFFQNQTVSGAAGAMVGHVRFDHRPWAWKISPAGPDHAPLLHTAGLSHVICVGKPMPDSPDEPQGRAAAALAPDLDPAQQGRTPQNLPQDHSIDEPVPAGLGGIYPLESLPGAAGVIYLDFDGEPRPFNNWTIVTTDAAPSGNSNAQIKDIWQRVAEDFQPFNLNITTDRRVFDRTPPSRRQHVIITPTTTAAPGAGGTAFVGSFNWTGHTVCWVFVLTGKNAAEAISHEAGHALGLAHDGRSNPAAPYYEGHGSGDVSWAPLMGAGYSRSVSQWSKGEYGNADNTEDDLDIIVSSNNTVDYRADDTGSTWATARYLDFGSGGSVANEGIIETGSDVDAWRFETAAGQVSLSVSTVNVSPNLDLLAEIHDQSGRLIVSENPDTQLNTAITANLAAGGYILRISGVGRGDPKTTGYSDYGSLGGYLISGTIQNGIRNYFSLPENSPAGTILGSIAPGNDDVAHAIRYAIVSGNTGGAFALNPENGQLSVANAGVLDYETLSTGPDDPASFELMVTFTDRVNPLLTESHLVTVIINPINEAPTLTAGNVTLFTRTRPGTHLLTVSGSDPDRDDFPRFTMASDSSGGGFAIDPITGLISLTDKAPASVPASPHQLTIRATDQSAPALSTEVTVAVNVLEAPAGYPPGGLKWTHYDGIAGSAVKDLIASNKFTGNSPDGAVFQPMADSGSHGISYGSTARAWVLPPASGAYTFWISGDDSAELWLSSNDSPTTATLKASAPAPTGRYQYDKYPAQRSAPVQLTAGTRYYLEARHKQGTGADHLVIAWQGPGFDRQVIRGLYLVPYSQAPTLTAGNVTLFTQTRPGTPVLTVTARDPDRDETPRISIVADNSGGAFAIHPTTGLISLTNNAPVAVPASPYQLTIRAADQTTPALSAEVTITIKVLETPAGYPPGGLKQTWYEGIPGSSVNDLITSNKFIGNSPDGAVFQPIADSGSHGINYGSTARAWVLPPASGAYTFWISGDDSAELWLSSDASPTTATLRASATGPTGRYQYDNHASQRSAPVNLTAGTPYYLEARHKQGDGPDHLVIAWQGPGIDQQVISGLYLVPYSQAPTLAASNATLFTRTRPGTPVLTVTGSDPDGDDIPRFSIVADNSGGAFAIDPSTGLISLTNNAPVAVPASPYQLTIRATDQTISALKTDVTIVITVLEAPAGYNPGGLMRTWYEGIPGSTVDDLIISTEFTGDSPDGAERQPMADSGSHGINYGSAARAWLLPPASGAYTFWISGDDSAELWLSSDNSPITATLKASATGPTGRYQYDKYPTQRSAPVHLTAGTPYFLEARHKQDNGADHLVIAWQGPEFDRQVISGLYMVPYLQIFAPRIGNPAFTLRREADTGTWIGTVPARRHNGSGVLASFTITGGSAAPWCAIDANTGLLYLKDAAGLQAAATPAHLTVEVSEAGTPPLTGTGLITLNIVTQEAEGVAEVVQEIWTDIAGTSVASLTWDPRYPDSPSTTRPLTKLDTGADYGGSYGSRIRAMITAPETGTYQFYIASDSAAQLFFAPDVNNWGNALQIASAGSSTGRGNWSRFVSQKSVPVQLTTGQRAYLEVRHKAGSGPDFVQVAWTTPGSATPGIISAPALGAFETNHPPVWNAPAYQFKIRQGSPAGTIAGRVAASDSDTSQLNYTIAGGNTGGAFSLNPFTGNLILTNPAVLVPGQSLTLSLRVQDDGTNGRLPLQTATTTATITVSQDMLLLSPRSQAVNLPTDQGLELEVAASGRPGASMAWSKVSGPGDVLFDDAGGLVTGAIFSASGFYVIRATETAGGIPLSLYLTVQAGGTPALLRGGRIDLRTLAPAHSYDSGAWEISAGGSGLANVQADSCYFINQTGTAEVAITARITSVQNVSSQNSMAGLMIREGPAPDARSVFCGITSSNGLVTILRSTPGLTSRPGSIDTGRSPPFAPIWLRLERSGNSFTASSAPDLNGLPGPFTAMSPAWTLPMNPDCLVGLAATSGSVSYAGTTTLDGLTITPSRANLAPTIAAAGPLKLSLQHAASLTGAVLDDLLPPNRPAATSVWKKVSGPGTVTFSSDTPATTASFSALGSYQLRLSAEDGEVRTFRDVLLAVVDSPIEDWRRVKFGTSTTIPARTGDIADPDQDNLSNLLEYALNLEPLESSTADISPVISEADGRRYPGIIVSRNPDATDVAMVIETSSTPGIASSWLTTGTIVEINTPTQLRVRTATPLEASQRQFLRLKVIR